MSPPDSNSTTDIHLLVVCELPTGRVADWPVVQSAASRFEPLIIIKTRCFLAPLSAISRAPSRLRCCRFICTFTPGSSSFAIITWPWLQTRLVIWLCFCKRAANEKHIAHVALRGRACLPLIPRAHLFRLVWIGSDRMGSRSGSRSFSGVGQVHSLAH